MDEKFPGNVTPNAYNSPLLGMWHFLMHRTYWLRPLLFSTLSWLFIAVVFVLVLLWLWPQSQPLKINYIWGIIEAASLGMFTILFAWALILPFFLDFAFEALLKKFLRALGLPVVEKKITTFSSECYVLWKTLLWRFSWLAGSLMFALIVPPFSFLITGIGLAHIALVDGADLALGIMGLSDEERIGAIRERDSWFLLSAVVSGLIGLVLLPTFIGWIIWLPSMYLGAALWCTEWGVAS